MPPRTLLAPLSLALLLAAPAAHAQVGQPGQATQAAPEAQPQVQEPAPEKEQTGDWLPGEFSGAVYLTNNYIFRGISQTDNGAALQGSIGYKVPFSDLGLTEVPVSLYGAVWGSNLDFNDDIGQNNKGAHLELDWSFGLTGDIGDTGLTWSLGGVYYHYPDARSSANYDYWEIAPALIYQYNEWLTFQANFAYSPDFFAASGNGYYLAGTAIVKIPIPHNWFGLSLNATTGHQWVEKSGRFGASGSYQHWLLGATVNIKGVDFSAAYSDTSIGRGQCFGNTNLCGPKAVLTMALAF